ncbi:hypothetical protein CDAR_31361 [Caerostris darwini]|uniref:IBB domain-containing protein n=1 Tax=Caerostris darwini TaxID=1538125 RepID=A0AAV4Q7T7_9ARAC|nr:hypothetical protein CDAR_31361 [Caerostris darwini]
MQGTDAEDPISRLRMENRKKILAHRKEDRESFFKQKRLKFCEVEALVSSVTNEQFEKLVLELKLKKPHVDALKAIKRNCCTSVRTEAFFRIEGGFNGLVRFLLGKDAHLQLEAVACLTNLACCSHKAAQRIAKTVGPYLVSFIGSGSYYLQDQCAWAAGNVANDCFKCFSLLKAQGIVPALLTLLKSPSSEVVKSAVYALHACTKYGDPDLRSLAELKNLECLLSLIEQKNIEKSVLSSAGFTLSNIFYLAAMHNYEISNHVAEIVSNCLYNNISSTKRDILIALPLVRCLGFMTLQDNQICRFLLEESNFHLSTVQILNSEFHCLKVEFLWVLTNIAAYGEISTSLIDLKAVLNMIEFSTTLLDNSCMQVLYYLCTIIVKSDSIREMLYEQDVILKIQPLLNSEESILRQVAETFLSIINKT